MNFDFLCYLFDSIGMAGVANDFKALLDWEGMYCAGGEL